MTTDCLVRETKEVRVETSKPDSGNEFTFWRLNEDSESKIEAMRNWERKVTCHDLCSCYPAQALQVCELSISTKEDSTIASKAYIFGSFAIRDHYDRRRINIFNSERTDPVPINFINGVGKVRITNTRRGILYGNLAFDYDLNIIHTTLEGYNKEEKIDGKALYNGKKRPYSSHPEIIHASIPITGDSKIKETNLKFIRFPQGIEAEIKIEPPQGLDFHLTARMGDLPEEILVFDSNYSMTRGNANHNSLKFVLVVPFLDTLELKYTDHNHPDEKPNIRTFNSLYHGFSSEDITLKSGTIRMEIKWSRM
ncbi:unnamed protein product [Urochloa decumbens]|uniref:DUF6598 domain-containing protein n=1 Tax=Urochloa decumbens TaxID=240449 RepID=A0ABC8VKP6_9POAL